MVGAVLLKVVGVASLLAACADAGGGLVDPGGLEEALLDDPLAADLLQVGDPMELDSEPARQLMDYVAASVDLTWTVPDGNAMERAAAYARAGQQGEWQMLSAFCTESQDRYWLRFTKGPDDRTTGTVVIEPRRVEVFLSAAHPDDETPIAVPAAPSTGEGYVDCLPLDA